MIQQYSLIVILRVNIIYILLSFSQNVRISNIRYLILMEV